jgi:uncharacterized protein YjlB
MQDPAVEQHLLGDDGTIPNNEELPLLVYPAALSVALEDGSTDPASHFEHVFAGNGWGGAWRNGVFPYHHYHSSAHEVLGCYSGSAQVQFGGPQGVIQEINAGDVVVIPAGVSHKRLSASRDFRVVGAYPPRQHMDMNYGRTTERDAALRNIPRTPVPATDPVYGGDGPLIRLWATDRKGD